MKLIKPLDVALIIFVSILSVVLIFLFIDFNFENENGENKTAVIRVNGEIVQQIDLSSVKSSYDMYVEGSHNVYLTVYNDGVEFKKSDCADKVCINTGKITRVGSSAVCLPERVSVEIVNSGSLADAVVW